MKLVRFGPQGREKPGILDSKGSRPADNGGTGNAVYVGDTGYGLFTSISTAASTSWSAGA